jgi:alpha-1,3-glucosyltransferase
MLTVQAEPVESPECVTFQRLTVVLTGLALAAVAWWATAPSPPSSAKNKPTPNDNPSLLFFLITCNAGLLMVDYVHFQYNGWLMALLLLAILLVERGGEWQLMENGKPQWQPWQRRQRRPAFAADAAAASARTRYLLASVAFAALLNAKHLFAYAAPAFFVYLLRAYVLDSLYFADASSVSRRDGPPPPLLSFVLPRLALLGAGVSAVFAASLGPFIALGGLPDVVSRLFPFGRGLLHAYWAPNTWALYAAADKVLAAAAAAALARAGAATKPRGGGGHHHLLLPNRANMSGGLVGIAEFSVLPQVGPKAAAAVTLAAMLPALVALWRRPCYGRFCAAVAHGMLCGFMFGYHVHEKAVLTFLMPMALVAARRGGDYGGAGDDPERARSRGGAAAAAAAARDSAADEADEFLLASTAGHVGIFPLLFRPQELVLRWALAAFYFVVAAWGLGRAGRSRGGGGGEGARRGAAVAAASAAAHHPPLCFSFSFSAVPFLFAWGCVALELFNALVAPKLLPNLPFLPLMLTSVWCAAAIALVWLRSTLRWWTAAAAPPPPPPPPPPPSGF